MFCREKETEYYKKLFDLEVYLRFIVIWELKGNWGTNWKSVIPAAILEEVEVKKNAEKSIGYVDYQTHGLLSYCSISELRDLITGPLWEKCFFNLGAKECILADFKRVIAVRNKLAHFRNITCKDLRNLDYFFDYLADWSEDYGRLSKYSPCLTLESLSLKRKVTDELKAFLHQLDNEVKLLKDIEFKVCGYLKGSHFSIQITLDNNIYSNLHVIKILDAGSKFLSFVSLSKLGNSIEIFISLKTPLKNLTSFIPAILDLLSNTSELEGSQYVEEKYEKYISEVFLLTDKTLPYQFSK